MDKISRVTRPPGYFLYFFQNNVGIYKTFADQSHSISEICETLEISRATLCRYVKEAESPLAEFIEEIMSGPRVWEAYQINWKVSSPYGVQRSLHGFDGLVQLYQVYCAICEEIFSSLQLPKLAICNRGDWETYYRRILTFLQLPPALPAR